MELARSVRQADLNQLLARVDADVTLLKERKASAEDEATQTALDMKYVRDRQLKGGAWVTEWVEKNVKLVGTSADMSSAVGDLLQFKELFRGITGSVPLGNPAFLEALLQVCAVHLRLHGVSRQLSVREVLPDGRCLRPCDGKYHFVPCADASGSISDEPFGGADSQAVAGGSVLQGQLEHQQPRSAALQEGGLQYAGQASFEPALLGADSQQLPGQRMGR